MKLCIVVIASRGKDYDELIALWRSIRYPGWVTVKFVFADPDHPESISMTGDTIIMRGKECYYPGIHYKTVAAMEYLLKNEEFDYLLRSNLSSFFNADSLLAFLDDKPRTNAMFGKCMFDRFLSGSGYVMTRDVVEKFVHWDCSDEVNPMRMYDDEIVGVFMLQNGIPYYTWNWEDAATLNNTEAIHIRCHCERGFVRVDPLYGWNITTSASPEYFRVQVERYNAKAPSASNPIKSYTVEK